MNSKLVVLIDCGHGGIDSNGRYTTAPAKMYKFPDGVIAYEGVENREIGQRLGDSLTDEDIQVVYTVLPSNSDDVSLASRVELENALYKAGYDTMFISLHSNAGKGTGFEIFTSIGETQSDLLATCIGKEIQCQFPNIAFRKDTIDGDLDKESNFYVLRKTLGISVLIESLFFDNREDFELLSSDLFRKRVSTAIKTGILNYLGL